MFVENLLLACWSCLNGHRARTCNHTHRSLYALKNKGRPRSTTPRSKDSPDILSLHDPSFAAFVSSVLNDPILKKEYFHAENPAEKGPAKRAAPYPKRGASPPGKRGREEEETAVDIYVGRVGVEGVTRWRELCGLVDVVLGTVADPPPFASGDEVVTPVLRSPGAAITSPLTPPIAVPMDEIMALENGSSSPVTSEMSLLESDIMSPTTSGDDIYSPDFVYCEDIDPHLFDIMTSFIHSSSTSADDNSSFMSNVLRDGQILPMTWEKDLEAWDHELATYPNGSALFTGLFEDPFNNGIAQDINYLNTAECIAR